MFSCPNVFYVHNEIGDDSASGSSPENPFKTLTQAFNASATTKGCYTIQVAATNTPYFEEIRPRRGGSLNAPVAIQGFDSANETRKPLFQADNPHPNNDPNQRPSSHNCISLVNMNYVAVDNIICDGRGTGDTDDWRRTGFLRHVLIHGGSHNTISRSDFRGAVTGYPDVESLPWSYTPGNAISIQADGEKALVADYNQILHNSLELTPKLSNNMGAPKEGIALGPYARRNLIEGNTVTLLARPDRFVYSSHNVIQIQGSFNVIRKNIFTNYMWRTAEILRPDLSTTTPQGYWDSLSSKFGYENAERNLFERNNILHSARAVTTSDPPFAMQLQSPHNILRGNTFWDSQNGALAMPRGSNPNHSRFLQANRIYHNSFLSSLQAVGEWVIKLSFSRATFCDETSPTTVACGHTGDNRIFNNFIFNFDRSDFKGKLLHLNMGSDLNGLPIFGLGGTHFSRNIFSGDGATPLFTILEENQWETPSLLKLESTYPNFAFENEPIQDPKVRFYGDGDYQILPTSRLRESALGLTRVSRVLDEKRFEVEDARAFHGGISQALEGGQLQVYHPPDTLAAVRLKTHSQIEFIDYERNIIHVRDDLGSIRAGDELTLPFDGSRPNIGAH